MVACAPGEADKDQAKGKKGPQARDFAAGLRKLERQHRARVGVFAHNTETGRTLVHRADERFPLCSTWKPLAVAALMKDRHEGGGDRLGERVRYSRSDLVEHSPVTGTRAHLDGGMTVEQLCDAAVRYSDNTAANLLLRELGGRKGPEAVTRFCRSLGDRVTRLDRWETELNSAEPWQRKDTTSPRALSRTYTRLVLGDVLEPPERRKLTGWLEGCTTGDEALRAGLPEGWTIGEKTGSGSYGTNNDVGVAWTDGDRAPVVIAVLTTKKSAEAEPDYPLIAKTARLLGPALVRGGA